MKKFLTLSLVMILPVALSACTVYESRGKYRGSGYGNSHHNRTQHQKPPKHNNHIQKPARPSFQQTRPQNNRPNNHTSNRPGRR